MAEELRDVSLDDKYRVESDTVFVNGAQALARLPMIQRGLDLAAGMNTAGFISGYRGSPARSSRHDPLAYQGSAVCE